MNDKQKLQNAKTSAERYSRVAILAKAAQSDDETDNQSKGDIFHTVETVANVKRIQKRHIQRKYHAKLRMASIKERVINGIRGFLTNPISFFVKKSTKIGVTVGIAVGLLLSLPNLVTTFTVLTHTAGELRGATSFLSTQKDMLKTEALYRAKEGAILQNILSEYDFDEYVLHDSGCTYSHDPYALASLLTAKQDTYTADDPFLTTVFEAQYTIQVSLASTEKWVRSEKVPWTILYITVSDRSLDEVAQELLTEEEYSRYTVLMQTKGNMPDLFS